MTARLSMSQHRVLVTIRPMGSWGALARALEQVREGPGVRPVEGDKDDEGTGASL